MIMIMNADCRRAAANAYLGLKGRRVADVVAFDAATMVFRFHNPGISLDEARRQVAVSLDELQADA